MMSFSLIAQTSSDKIEKFKEINGQVVAKYKEGKYKDALKIAKQALEMSVEIFGAEHDETAATYSNLGEIYRAKKDYGEAAESFEKALAIYQKNSVGDEKKIAGVLKSLGTVLAFDGKKEKAEETLLNALANAEKVYGRESKEILPYLQLVSEIYVVTKQFDKANEMYIRRYLTALKVLGKDSDELQTIRDERECVLFRALDPEASLERNKKFYAATITAGEEKSANVINGGIVNGKADSLPQPEYPASARAAGATGTIVVRVSIDEEGNVISAKALCDGHPALRQAAEDAARKARFQPTKLDGVAVSVTGTIIYNFIR